MICTGTALVILTAVHMIDIPTGSEGGVSLVADALSTGPLGQYSAGILAVLILMFVLASIVSSFSLCEANIKFLSSKPVYSTLLKVVIISVVFIASLAPADLIWSMADIFMAVLGISNMTAVLLLKDYITEALDDYKKQKSENKDPMFDVGDLHLDISGITVWGSRSGMDPGTKPRIKKG